MCYRYNWGYITPFSKTAPTNYEFSTVEASTVHLKRTMTANTTRNFTALPIAISGSATIHVMDQERNPWALYDLFGARTSKFLERCRISSGVFADYV